MITEKKHKSLKGYLNKSSMRRNVPYKSKEQDRAWHKRHMQGKRAYDKLNVGGDGKCQACGYSLTVDLHHEGEERKEHILCPSCHALVTRGIKTLEELLAGCDDFVTPLLNYLPERTSTFPLKAVPKPVSRGSSRLHPRG